MPEQDGPSDTGSFEENVPFDREQLYEIVQEIGGYLTELRHIDLVHDYYAGRSPEERNEQHLQSPSFHEFSIPLGETFPFILHFVLYFVDPTQVEWDLSQLAGEAEGWATDRAVELSELVRPIAFPLVRQHDSLIGETSAVLRTLDLVPTDFGELANNLGDWKGGAAENFADHFYQPFGDCLDNQRELVLALLGALAVSKGIINYSQQGLMNAVSTARATLREQLLYRSQGAEATSLKSFLSVTSRVTGVAGLILSGVPLLGLTLDIVSVGLDLAAMTLPEEPAILEVEGRSAEELAESTCIAIGEIATFVGHSYGDLYKELALLRGHIDDLRDNRLLLPDRPDLADGVGGGDFHHTTSSRYTG